MKNDSPFRDESEANPESVLEKLKRYNEDLEELNKIEGFGTARSEWEDVRAYSRCHFEIHILPRLIAALELVEAKAFKEIPGNKHFISDSHVKNFAREVLAVVNRETKGE